MGGRWVVGTATATLLAIFGVPETVAGQEDAEELVIRGLVVDPAGNPIAQALVGLAHLGEPVATDDRGIFALPVEPDGEYRVVVEQLGYHRVELRLTEESVELPLRIRLDPDPVALDGIEVTTDRWEQRRRGFASMVRVVDLEDLAFTTAINAHDVVRQNSPAALIACESPQGADCFVRRGLVVEQTVCINDQRAERGRDELRSYPPHELYMVEVHEWGQLVRVYTRFYVENHMRNPPPIRPPDWGC